MGGLPLCIPGLGRGEWGILARCWRGPTFTVVSHLMPPRILPSLTSCSYSCPSRSVRQ